MYVVVPRRHPRAGADEVELAELRDDAWIQGPAATSPGLIRELCREAGFEPRIAFESDDPLATRGIVAAGLAVTLVPGLTKLDTARERNVARAGAARPAAAPCAGGDRGRRPAHRGHARDGRCAGARRGSHRPGHRLACGHGGAAHRRQGDRAGGARGGRARGRGVGRRRARARPGSRPCWSATTRRRRSTSATSRRRPPRSASRASTTGCPRTRRTTRSRRCCASSTPTRACRGSCSSSRRRRRSTAPALTAQIPPGKDVDGLTPLSAGPARQGPARACGPARRRGHGAAAPPRRRSSQGAEAVVVGRSDLVGKPVAALLLAANATVTICHSRTRDLAEVCRRADVLVAAVGRPGLVQGDWVKPGATVIDVGINRTDDGLVGDVEFAAAERARPDHAGPRRRRPDDDRDAAAQHAARRPRRRRGAGGGRVELSRLRPGELIAAAGGVALLVVMFLDWYAVGGTTSVGGSDVRISLGLTAWEAFAITDVLLALAALIAIGLAVITAARRSPALPVAVERDHQRDGHPRHPARALPDPQPAGPERVRRGQAPGASSASCACWRSPPAAGARCATSSGRTRRCRPTCARPRPPRARASPPRRPRPSRAPRLHGRMLSRDQVLHVARLARLELTEEEVERMAEELSKVLDHIEKIGELGDLADVPPTSHVVDGRERPARRRAAAVAAARGRARERARPVARRLPRPEPGRLADA